jgi:hypothetical protein
LLALCDDDNNDYDGNNGNDDGKDASLAFYCLCGRVSGLMNTAAAVVVAAVNSES